jgi:hypothetical protein
VLISAALCLIASGCASSSDLVVCNAKIWTGDPVQPAARIIAVRDGRFVYVGDDANEAARHVSTNARRIDAHGARIIPGLIDAHLHLISGGLQLSRIQLRDVPNREAFIAAVAERAKKTPRGDWIPGGRWSTESWPDPAQPTKEWIDPVTPAHPVLLSRMDGHGALANSVALKIAGIDAKGPPDPPGGQIERDAKTNEPTGILKDAAIELVTRRIPELSDRQHDAGLAAAMTEAHRHGITCVHTMSPWRDVAALDRARSANKLTLRVRVYVSEDDWNAHISKAKAHNDDEWVAVRGFKRFADGSMGSRTAYMAAPYVDLSSDEQGASGLLREGLQPLARFQGFCDSVFAADYSPATHAIGDQANHVVLDCYEETLKHRSAQASSHRSQASPRPRIEHAQHLLPADIPRFAKLGVVASMQPYHKADDGRYAEKAIGPERCKTSYAFRSLLDGGAHVAFGSDWPVVSLNPFLGIHAAVTGRTLDGKVFVPGQKITVEEALRCYTSGAAYAAGDDQLLGQIKVGRPADFVVLGQDILTIPAANLSKVQVLQTFVNGKEVWKNPLPIKPAN